MSDYQRVYLNEVWLPTLHPWPISCRVDRLALAFLSPFGIIFTLGELETWEVGLSQNLQTPDGLEELFFNGTYQLCHFWGICSLSVSSILRRETTKIVILLYVQSRKIQLGRTNGGPSCLRFPQLWDAYSIVSKNCIELQPNWLQVPQNLGCKSFVLIHFYPLVNVHKKLWTDPPCYSWVNQLFRLGHFPVREL